MKQKLSKSVLTSWLLSLLIVCGTISADVKASTLNSSTNASVSVASYFGGIWDWVASFFAVPQGPPTPKKPPIIIKN